MSGQIADQETDLGVRLLVITSAYAIVADKPRVPSLPASRRAGPCALAPFITDSVTPSGAAPT